MNKHLQKLLATLTGSLVVLTLLLGISSNGSRAASLAATVPSNWIKGANMIGYSPDPYSLANQHDAVASWKSVGGNAIAFAPRWFMDAPTSTTMGPDASFGSPSDESVVAAIDEAHSQGLRVMLRPYVDVKDGSWRGQIIPSNVAAWFASYTAFMDHYLDLAKAHNVDEFTLGVEMLNMTEPKYDSYWLTLIADARARFPGLLTYSANWGKSTDGSNSRRSPGGISSTTSGYRPTSRFMSGIAHPLNNGRRLDQLYRPLGSDLPLDR